MLAPCRRKIVLMLNPSAQTCSDAFEWKLFREHQFLRIWLGSKRPSCSGRWQTATVVRKKFKIKAIREVYFKWEILQVLKPFKNCLPFSTKSCLDIVKRRAVSLQIRIRFFCVANVGLPFYKQKTRTLNKNLITSTTVFKLIFETKQEMEKALEIDYR